MIMKYSVRVRLQSDPVVGAQFADNRKVQLQMQPGLVVFAVRYGLLPYVLPTEQFQAILHQGQENLLPRVTM